MKTIFIFLLLAANVLCYSQEKFYAQLEKQKIDTSQVHLINKSILKEIIQSGDAEIYWVGIFINNCVGTPYILKSVSHFDSIYKSRIKIILSSSEKYKDAASLLEVLRKHSLKSFPVYIIDGEIYREKHDTRYKGLEFRNNICEECKYSIIGVPYSIFFDKKGEIIKYGYMSKEDISKLLTSVIK